MNASNFFRRAEAAQCLQSRGRLRRRWLGCLSQGIAQVFPVFDIPNWVVRLIVLLIVIGFADCACSRVGVRS